MGSFMHRRQVLGLLAATALPGAAWSQAAFPARPISWVIGFPPGGPTDLMSRLIASDMAAQLNGIVTVENKPGGGGALALTTIANSAKDGHTIGIGSLGPMVMAPALQQLPYAAKDFSAIGKIGEFLLALVVSAELGVSTIDELVALVKANPGKYNFASDGIGTSTHLAFELFRQRMGGLDVVHIPLKGVPEILQNYASGDVHMSITNLQSVSGQVKAGQLKALAAVGSGRSPVLPDVPTMQEAGVPDFAFSSFLGVVGPAGIPDEAINRMSEALRVALAKPELKKQLEDVGGIFVDYRDATEMAAQVAADDKMWRDLIATAGIKAGN